MKGSERQTRHESSDSSSQSSSLLTRQTETSSQGCQVSGHTLLLHPSSAKFSGFAAQRKFLSCSQVSGNNRHAASLVKLRGGEGVAAATGSARLLGQHFVGAGDCLA
jgi:hypothetical protein